jgi:hypothetical protein
MRRRQIAARSRTHPAFVQLRIIPDLRGDADLTASLARRYNEASSPVKIERASRIVRAFERGQ